jgi:hypothetical protein
VLRLKRIHECDFGNGKLWPQSGEQASLLVFGVKRSACVQKVNAIRHSGNGSFAIVLDVGGCMEQCVQPLLDAPMTSHQVLDG